MIIYFCQFVIKIVFYIKFTIMSPTLYLFLIFVLIWCKYNLQRNFKFRCIFNTFKFVQTFIVFPFHFKIALILYRFNILEKLIYSCFYSLNLKSCRVVHSTILCHAFVKILQLRFVNSLYVNIFISSTKLMTLKHSFTFSHMFNRFVL